MATNQSKIQELTLEDVMGDRFGRYSKYIIQERALPDIRDGLKPVQRRILYAMNQDGNTFDKSFRKSAKSVGNVMGNFHPHGDSSIYEAMVRLSQDWKLREPLIEMHGNNGSMDGDPAAAMRYTEARLSKIAGEMLQDIDRKTVDMVLNFDDTEYEPTVLPARFPNLLVNGATGISAGYATEIPPHNLGEVIDAILFLMNHPKANLADLMDFVKGPDFPTGGIIQGLDGIKKAYETGRGRIAVRSRTKIVPLKGNKAQIEVSEIPYEVNKAQLVKKMDEIRIMKKIEGIAEVRDESDRKGLSIVIELKRDVNAAGILTYLFKNTDLQITYNFNMVAIYHQRPEHVGLKTILTAYLEHQRDVITRRTQFNLTKAADRQHIVQGLIKAMSILDQVIATIRGSKDKKDAKTNLVQQFDFSEAQAEAIVTMQLYRLTNTDVTQLEREAAELAAAIERYHAILEEPKELDKVLRRELKVIQKAYPSHRLTEIQTEIQELKIETEVVIPQEDVVVMISHDGYIKRTSLRSYTASDVEDNGLKEADFPIYLAKNNTLDHLMMFTNLGHLIYRPVYEIADAKWKDTGEHISQTIGLAADERITWVFNFTDLQQTGKFLIATNDGYIKQTAFADYLPGRTYKTRASQFMKLKTATSAVVSVQYLPSAPTGTLVLLTQHGYGLRYDLSEVPTIGAKAVGVKSMDLRDDLIVRATIATTTDLVAMITQRGSFKKMKVADIPVTSRARRGVQVLRELKSKPHQIADYVLIDAQQSGVALEVLTDHYKRHSILSDEHPVSARYSNGSFVIDTDKEGTPVSIQVHPVPLTV
ncbi:DNA topoisomerase IV subunit A [Lactobacillus sp. CBA3605]|uniref:DNA topoisomerase IV subunit A n=1 Tax=Lactobacillus sp. CBA3605 TaxID=2099788 RepID=UPI000CFBD404|nr:DNA topoisomerase IV subunit A [Lactobacillus sp. CBA3605]AVK60407.1 DNA topoisomerase IV subunit A [Lactobacillus sp. CBA3605]